MSRIGNKIITVPEGVTVEIADDNTVTVTGSKGTLVKQFSPVISFKQEGNEFDHGTQYQRFLMFKSFTC